MEITRKALQKNHFTRSGLYTLARGTRDRLGAAPDRETDEQKKDNFHIIISDPLAIQNLQEACRETKQGFIGL